MDALTEKIKAALDKECLRTESAKGTNGCPTFRRTDTENPMWKNMDWHREPGDSWCGCWTCDRNAALAYAVADALRDEVKG